MVNLNLPIELLRHILAYMPHGSLFECMKVCTLWYTAGSAIYYKEVCLRTSHVRFLEMLESSNTRLGGLVHTLKVGTQSIPLTTSQFAQLISKLPNLKVIDFDDQNNPLVTIRYLKSFSKIAHTTHVEAVYIPHFKVESAKAPKMQHLHLMINNMLRKQITNLTLHSFQIRKLRNNADGLIKKLPKYVSLKHLVWNEGHDFSIDIVRLLNACPKLETLSIHSYHSLLPVLFHKPHHYLTSLNLQLPDLSQGDIKYIATSLPNLKQLDLRTYYLQSFCELYTSLDSSMKDELLSFFQKLDVLKIRSVSNRKEQDLSLFWYIMHQLYNPSWLCDLTVYFVPPKSHSEEFSFDRHKGVFKISYEWVLAKPLGLKWARHLHLFRFSSVHIHNHHNIHRHLSFTELIQLVLIKNNVPTLVSYNGIAIDLKKQSKRSDIHSVYLRHLPPEEDLLQTVALFYPTIKEITMIYCRFPMNNDNHYLIDLRQFEDVHKLTFDIHLILTDNAEVTDIHILEIGDHIINVQHYKRNVSTIKCPHVGLKVTIKILYTKLRQIDFKRNEDVLLVENHI